MNNASLAFLGFVIWLDSAMIALAQEAVAAVPAAISWMDLFTKATPFVIAGMIILRALAEGLLMIANALSNDGNDVLHKIANIAASAASFLAKLAAMFGIGMPNQLVTEKADKLAAKEVSAKAP